MAADNKKQAWLLSDSSNVLTTFKLMTISDCKHLTDWQNTTGKLEPFEKQWLALVRRDLSKSWNVKTHLWRMATRAYLEFYGSQRKGILHRSGL